MTNKDKLNQADAEIMDLIYEIIQIHFGVDIVIDSTELREILKKYL